MKTTSNPKVKCAHCGRLFPPRIPKGGDGSFAYPKRHNKIEIDLFRNKFLKEPCPGNIQEAEILY